MSGMFSVPIGGMKVGGHSYEFKIDKAFFDQFEESEIGEGKLTAAVIASKQTTHIDLEIKISGTVDIECDRCLGVYSQAISCENRLLVRFGRETDLSDPDIVSVPADENELDMSQYFYEYILLALPMKRVHPADRNGKSSCDPAMLEKLEEYNVDEDKTADPRWDELKRLMNNN
jgi:uncharacterized metal-binding protein YceD (DUF177 family)